VIIISSFEALYGREAKRYVKETSSSILGLCSNKWRSSTSGSDHSSSFRTGYNKLVLLPGSLAISPNKDTPWRNSNVEVDANEEKR